MRVRHPTSLPRKYTGSGSGIALRCLPSPCTAKWSVLARSVRLASVVEDEQEEEEGEEEEGKRRR
eukprot:2030802-Rhodomonas_salina.1